MVVPALREQLTAIRERIETLNDSADAIEDYLEYLEPVEENSMPPVQPLPVLSTSAPPVR